MTTTFPSSMAPRVWLLLAIGLAAYGCSCPRKTMSFEQQAKCDEWVVVAWVDGRNEEVQKALRDTLRQNGILCFMQGSVAYDVLVPRALFDEAKRVLEHTPKLKRLIGVAEHPK
jgi:hypothetical protein